MACVKLPFNVLIQHTSCRFDTSSAMITCILCSYEALTLVEVLNMLRHYKQNKLNWRVLCKMVIKTHNHCFLTTHTTSLAYVDLLVFEIQGDGTPIYSVLRSSSSRSRWKSRVNYQNSGWSKVKPTLVWTVKPQSELFVVHRIRIL